jgi:hypothetical protein
MPSAQSLWRKKREKRGEIGDVVSQTVGAKNISVTQCSIVTLWPTFWGRNVTILGGRTICHFWVLVSPGRNVFGRILLT